MTRIGLIFIILGYLAIIAIGILTYVLKSYALYGIARRRMIRYPWMAWIPVVDAWTIGGIVEDYDLRLGVKRNWKTAFLTLKIIQSATVVMVYVWLFVSALTGMYSSYGYDSYGFFDVYIGVMILFYSILIFEGIALTAVSTICNYKIFESTVPEKSLKYMLISLLVPLGEPICLFKCMNREPFRNQI